MRAIRYHRTGPAKDVLDLIEVEQPTPGPGEVLVRVAASGINPHDTKKRSGWTGEAPPESGVTPHSDGAGIIEAVGDGVDPRRFGQRVFVLRAPRTRGTAAEFVVVQQACAITLPVTFSFAEGACLGVPGFTAWLAVLSDGPVTGQTILVNGGGGAVGRVAVEIAARSGARVIATAGSAASQETARRKGADLVLDRHTDDIARTVLEITGGRGAERIVDVDFGANQALDIAALAAHGTLAAYSSTSDREPKLDYYGFARKAARLVFVQGALLSNLQLREATEFISAMIRIGFLRPDIAAVFAIEDVAKAHDVVETGAPANVVVEWDPVS
ncbi:MAG: NADPH:quinone reductase [Paracoccaceae bacterium]